MRGMLAVLERELTEWRLLFVAALVTGLIPLAVPWMPNPGGLEPGEMRDGTAVGLAAIVSTVLAFLLGSSVLARDLSEKRLGFYFARPLSGGALWAGKMLGAAILVFGTGFLILLPTLLAGGNIAEASRWGASTTVDNLIALLVPILGLLLLLVTSHALSVMVRSRSPWLLLDIAALALLAAALWACRRALLAERAYFAVQGLEAVLTGIFLLAVSVAGFLQVTRGRTDLRRGHRLLSLTLWSVLGVATLGCMATTRWVLAATPRDLVDFHTVQPAPSGSWIAVGGVVRNRGGYTPTFLLDLASGRFFKLESLALPYIYGFERGSFFSRDGSRAAWLSETAGEDYVLSTLDLRRPGAVPARTTVSYPDMPQSLALSPDGFRIAARWYDRLTVDDLRTGRLLISASLPPDPDRRDLLRFRDGNHLQIFQSSQIEEPGRPPVWRLATADLDIASRRMARVGQVDIAGREGFWQLSPDGEFALLHRIQLSQPLLAHLRSGRTLTLSTSSTSQDSFAARFLADGRLAVTEEAGERILFRLLSPEGSEQLRAYLPGSRVLVGGQPTPGLLAVATRKLGSDERKTWTSWLLDLQTGRVRRLANGLLPTTMGPREPGSLPSRMFYRRYGDLLLLDPATGKLRTVLPGTDSPSRSVQIFHR